MFVPLGTPPRGFLSLLPEEWNHNQIRGLFRHMSTEHGANVIMKELLPLFGNLSLALSTVGFLFVTAAKLPASEQTKMSSTNVYSEGLWTREPTRVDVSKQNFTRVAAAPRSELAMVAQAPAVTKPVNVASLDVSAGKDVLDTNDMSAIGPDPAHVQWCFARYRSYDPADNTYRSFSGEKRTCMSPSEPYAAAAANTSSATAVSDTASLSPSSEAACSARYRSYDRRDNTYQPFDGGPRRPCALPM